jgi:hypothetical protein
MTEGKEEPQIGPTGMLDRNYSSLPPQKTLIRNQNSKVTGKARPVNLVCKNDQY